MAKSFFMQKNILLLFLFIATKTFAQDTRPYQSPNLVVGIIVDQMRYDYLMRYWNKYGEGGFKRLINKGLNCENTHFNYMPTYTGPGHASIYAGSSPSAHGIISNDWFSRAENKMVYCAEDTSVRNVGGGAKSGSMSPKRLISSNISDELRLFSQGKSKVIGIALKDRGAIMPAGHAGNTAYWFDLRDTTGQWMTSSFYLKELPTWAKEFNAQKKANSYLSQVWNPLLPIQNYTESTEDNTVYEGKYTGEEKPVFPHNLPVLRKTYGYPLIAATPFGNSLTKDFALAALKGEQLGQDQYPDLLAVSFSSTDYVGHQFGTMAVETEDTYLRLDRDLAEMFAYLDENIPNKNYVIFLTADHGATYNPNYLKDHRIPAGLWNPLALEDSLRALCIKKWGDNFILSFDNQQIYLDKNKMQAKNLPETEIKAALIPFLLAQNGVENVFDAETFRTQEFTKDVASRIQNGYMPKRSGDLIVHFSAGWLDYGETGTSHGSPHNYDTHVPLLWYGKGIKSGTYTSHVNITDIAPTLAILFNCSFPNACTGEPIEAVLKKEGKE